LDTNNDATNNVKNKPEEIEMTEKSGYIKSRKIGSKTSEMDIPMEGFAIEDKDEEHEKNGENDDQNREDETVVKMRISSISGAPQTNYAAPRAAPDTVTPHKQALCDNIDAWALWISPPVFLFFNLVYWVAYRHVNEFEFDNT